MSTVDSSAELFIKYRGITLSEATQNAIQSGPLSDVEYCRAIHAAINRRREVQRGISEVLLSDLLMPAEVEHIERVRKTLPPDVSQIDAFRVIRYYHTLI